MATVEYLTPEEADQFKRHMPKSAVLKEYEQYLRDLPDGKVGHVVAKGEKPQTIKNRVVRAGKSLNITDLRIRRVGDNILFWREAGQE